MPTIAKHAVKVADEVWIAAALLHRESPDRTDFTVSEIVERAKEEAMTGKLRPGVYVHVVQHCVANRLPNPARYRMLLETGKNLRRLYREGDAYDPEREGGKIVPVQADIPQEYHGLIHWYFREYVPRGREEKKIDPLLALRGSGKELWADEHADDYIRRLREGWE